MSKYYHFCEQAYKKDPYINTVITKKILDFVIANFSANNDEISINDFIGGIMPENSSV